MPEVTVITGIAQGINASLVNRAHKHGLTVVANSRSIWSSDVGEDSAVLSVAGDRAGLEVARRIIGRALERFGRIDTPVSNTCICIPNPSWTTPKPTSRS